MYTWKHYKRDKFYALLQNYQLAIEYMYYKCCGFLRNVGNAGINTNKIGVYRHKTIQRFITDFKKY